MIPWLRRMWDRWKLWTQDPPIPFERPRDDNVTSITRSDWENGLRWEDRDD